MRAWLILSILLILPLASAGSVSDFPDSYGAEGNLQSMIVLGSNAGPKDTIFVINYLIGNFPNTFDSTSLTVIDDELGQDPGKLIIIGTPCQNSVVASILESNSCNIFESGQGYVAVTPEDNLIITGADEEGLEKAFIALNDEIQRMPDEGYLISGEKPYEITFRSIQAVETKDEAQEEPEPPEVFGEEVDEPRPIIIVPGIDNIPTPKEEIQIIQEDPVEIPTTETSDRPESPPPPRNIIQKVWDFLKALFLRPAQ